jgi:hypothetical protein
MTHRRKRQFMRPLPPPSADAASGRVLWHTFVEWTATDAPAEIDQVFTARRDDFVLIVWFAPEPFNSCSVPAWHYRVEHDVMLCSSGFCADKDQGRAACQRTAVKMAAFHGMRLHEDIAKSVAHLLEDPHSRSHTHDEDVKMLRAQAEAARSAGDTKTASEIEDLIEGLESLPPPARRVAIDGPSPKMLRRAAASRTPTEPAIPAIPDEEPET